MRSKWNCQCDLCTRSREGLKNFSVAFSVALIAYFLITYA